MAFDAATAAASEWVRQIADAAGQRNDPDAGLLACAVSAHLPGIIDATMPLLGVLLATSEEGYPDIAVEIERCIARYNARGLPLPDPLREYVAKREQKSVDFTRHKRGGSKWKLFHRDVALVSEAFDWRVKEAIDWRQHHPDLADPDACLHWTLHDRSASLDQIEETASRWTAHSDASAPSFFPSEALCRTYGLEYAEPQDDILRRIYPAHFRGLLIAHVAALCLSEWEGRIAAELTARP